MNEIIEVTEETYVHIFQDNGTYKRFIKSREIEREILPTEEMIYLEKQKLLIIIHLQ